MNPTTGYYSLIQYCPDPSRLEGANVGVLLFAPAISYLKALISKDNRRVRQFFGSAGHDWARLNSFKQGMVELTEAERPTIHDMGDLERFIARQANQFRITDPRPMRVTDPDKDLAQLFADLVGGEHHVRRQSLSTYLGERLERAGLEKKIRKDIRIHVSSFDREVEIPYGYQNGRFQLVRPAKFESGNSDRIEYTACRYAVEGESLFGNRDSRLGKVQLTVFGQFARKSGTSRTVVRKILEGHHVRLFATDEVDALIADIRTNAKELAPEG
jgi:hypothetical protein